MSSPLNRFLPSSSAAAIAGSALVLAAGISAVASRPACAQATVSNTVTLERQQVINRATQITTLESALGTISQESLRRGPVLAVSPQSVQPWRPKEPDGFDPFRRVVPIQPLPPPGARGHRLEDVAAYFGRKLVRLGSLTVLAPLEMVTLNDRPGPPNPLGSLRREQKMRMLQASLTPGQWRMLGSEQGLGASDLDKDQKALFLDLLPPDPVRLQKAKALPGGGWSVERRGPNDDGAVTLTPAQRAGMRLRLNRMTQLMLPATMNGRDTNLWINNRPSNTEFYTLQMTQSDYRPRPDAYGQTLRIEGENRLKASQLNFDAPALAVRIPLDGAKTIGDLIKRISETVGAEIYADVRVDKLPVSVKSAEGQTAVTAKAGDILKALCWAITGAFRRLEDPQTGRPVYLLTYDVEGIGTRKARLAEWGFDAQMAEMELRRKQDELIHKQQPLQYLDFAADDKLALPSEMRQKVEAQWKRTDRRYEPVMVKLTDLPPAHRAAAEDAIENNQRNTNEYSPRITQPGIVNLSIQIRAAFIIPGIGVVESQDGGNWASIYSLLPPPPPGVRGDGSSGPVASTEPYLLKGKIAEGATLLIAPGTPEEAIEAARAARLRGIRYLWVETPLDAGKDNPILNAAIQAGAEREMSVFAVVRLMHRPPASRPSTGDSSAAPSPSAEAAAVASVTDNADLDVNLLGETGSVAVARRLRSQYLSRYPGMRFGLEKQGDWVLPDAPQTLPRLKRQLLEIAATPGLSGIALVDTAAMGYGTKGDTQYFTPVQIAEFGYTPARRLAFLRAHGCDPLDIQPTNIGMGGGMVNLTLPFFDDINARIIDLGGYFGPDPNSASPRKHWNVMRYEANAKVLASLHEALRAAYPRLTLVMREQTTGSWFGTWDKADVLPARNINYYAPGQPSEAQSARQQSRRVLRYLPYIAGYPAALPYMPSMPDIRPDSPQAFAHFVSQNFVYDKEQWDGVVLDLSGVAVPKALTLLGGLAPPGAQRTPAAKAATARQQASPPGPSR